MTHRPWLAPLLFAAVLLAAAGAALALHVSSRTRSQREFQQHELTAAGEVAGVVEATLAGSARALRLLAIASDGTDPSGFDRMVDGETRCSASPCAAAVAVFAADGTLVRGGGGRIGLDAQQLEAALAWSRDPVSEGQIRLATVQRAPPALALIAPRAGGGVVVSELPFDVLFSRTRSDVSPVPYSVLVVSGAGDVMLRTGHPEMRLNNVFKRDSRCLTCHTSLEHVDRMVAMRRGTLEYTSRGVARVAAVSPMTFEGERWTVAAIAPATDAVALASSELRQLGALAIGAVVCLGLVARMSWREQNLGTLKALNTRLELAAVEWRMTVDTIDAAVLVLDPAGSIERMNRVASDLLPGAPFSWLGQPSAKLSALAPWNSALGLAGEAIDRNAVTMARVSEPAGGTTWDLWCRAPQRSDRRHSVVIVARDVTALVELQASVRRSETMAALGLVVAGVAHEVRNPLFAISSLVDAWSLRPEQPAPPHLIAALRREVFRLKTLMNELLEYGSPSAAEMAWHALAPVVDEAVAACRMEHDARRIRIEARVPSDVQVWMDPRRLVRVFINLLQNAAQHAPDGTAVTLALRRPAGGGDEIEIEVRDHGNGFAAEDLPRVFTPFFSRRAGGFGLGLAICARIVAEHGGRLAAANHPDGGAVLTVALPLVAPADAVGVAEGVETC